jgi:voltage-gated potassium channel
MRPARRSPETGILQIWRKIRTPIWLRLDDKVKNILMWSASLGVLLVLGSLGYVIIEGWSFFDALYMTVTTLTTVGYGEIHPLDHAGRVYTIVLILTGVGVMLYIVGGLARVVVEGEIQEAFGKRKIRRHVKKLKDHYIICGFGRLGGIIARELSQARIPVVVVESNQELVAKLEAQGYNFVAGDATREEILLEAGIERAKGLVAVLHSDAGNVYITLTGRSLNPKLYIVARGEETGSHQKLLRAGADKVESPYEMGGRKMAHTILRPTVVTFMELAMQEGVEWSMEEIAVSETSPLVGVPLIDAGIRKDLDLIVVAIKRADGASLFNPTPQTTLQGGDTLIVVGMRHNLEKLEELMSPH